ncbi:MAG: hypothetical protein ACLU4K_11835 [Oscillospiraceae bacterium]
MANFSFSAVKLCAISSRRSISALLTVIVVVSAVILPENFIPLSPSLSAILAAISVSYFL